MHSQHRAFARAAAQEGWEEALYNADRALEVQPGYAKALLRRSLAMEKLDRLDEALAGARARAGGAGHPRYVSARSATPPSPDRCYADVEAVAAMEPGNTGAAAGVVRLKAAVEARNERLKEEMMGKLKDAGAFQRGRMKGAGAEGGGCRQSHVDHHLPRRQLGAGQVWPQPGQLQGHQGPHHRQLLHLLPAVMSAVGGIDGFHTGDAALARSGARMHTLLSAMGASVVAKHCNCACQGDVRRGV